MLKFQHVTISRRDTMDWLMDDEMMRQSEEVSKEEEKITLKSNECGKLQAETARSAPELVVPYMQVKKRHAGKEKMENRAGWSTKMMEENETRV